MSMFSSFDLEAENLQKALSLQIPLDETKGQPALLYVNNQNTNKSISIRINFS